LKPKQRNAIEAVAMDMWDPFIKAVKKTAQCQNRFRSVPRSGQFWPRDRQGPKQRISQGLRTGQGRL
jgi:hypothetical protein